MAVQAVSARRLCGRRMHQFVEERFRFIHYDLRRGFSSSFDRGWPRLTQTALNEEESPVGNPLRNNEAQESGFGCAGDRPIGSFAYSKELWVGSSSARENGDTTGRLHSNNVGTGHSQGTTAVQQETSSGPVEIKNPERKILSVERARELKRRILQVRRGGGNSTHMPRASTRNEAIDISKNRQQQQGTTTIVQETSTTTIVQQTNRLVEDNNAGKTIFTVDRARELKKRILQVRRGDGYAHKPRASTTNEAIDLQKNRHHMPRTSTTSQSIDISKNRHHIPRASTTGEAIDDLKNRQQQGGIVDSYTVVDILKRCSQDKDLTAARQVHECIIQSGLDRNPYVANTLLNVYISCGRLDDARRVFDGLETKTVVSWRIMIGGYAKNGRAEEALDVFNKMREGGPRIDELTCSSILQACDSPSALKLGREVHAFVRHAGFESDVRVETAVVQMYARCGCITEARGVFEKLTNRSVITWNVMIGAYVANGSIDEARLVFDRMGKRDVITWNTMIGGYAGSGCGVEAYRLFLQMKREGFTPDAITYMSVLNASASAGASEWVKEVHSHAVRAGLESDTRVGNALVHMYAKSGSIDDARRVFDRMEKRDLTAWNIMIGAYAESGCGVDAYQLFLKMKWEGFTPDAITYVSILNASGSAGALEWVKEVHSHAAKAGLESDLRVGNALVHKYAKSGSIDDARQLFDKMEKRDVITWNIMIGAYAESGRGAEAHGLFLQMKREGFRPDAITCISILNAASSAGALEWVKDVHSHALEAGLESDIRVGNALVHMYAKSGSINEARLIFDRMETRDVITWNTMIGAYAESGGAVEAYRLFLQMKREGFKPDAVTYLSILNASGSAGALGWVKEVHSHVLKAGLESDLRVSTALIHMYAKNGSLDDAQSIFDTMEKRDAVTWTTMLSGLAQHGSGQEALELFKKMNGDGVKPDGASFVALLSACCRAGLVDDGFRLFRAMRQDYGIEPTVVHYTCMVDLLGRAGYLEEAKLFIGDMQVEPNAVTWQALLGACRTYGKVELGELAAQELVKLEPKNASAYVLLSNIYAAAGMWEKVSSVRDVMQQRGVQRESGRSWIEVDNEIHEFVAGDTSHPEAEAIYAELNRVTELLKAEGYVPDTRLVLQNIDEDDKELALCSHCEKLAVAYGLMHTPRGEPIRVYKNLRGCSDCHTATKFISKVTGREIIARDVNRFHHFKDGECSCGDYW